MNCSVSFIIVNYNTFTLTSNAIKSVFNTVNERYSFEVIIIDNSSQEEEFKTLIDKYSELTYFKMTNNLGFGRANNVGFTKSKGEYIFLLNSDSYLIDPNTIPVFIKYLKENSDVAAVGGNLITVDNKANISYGNFLSAEKVMVDLGLKERSRIYYEKKLATAKVCDFILPQKVDYITAAAIMIKRKVIETLGLFDEQYFMYFEDMELAYRYKMNGYSCVIIPEIKIVHLGGQSGIQNNRNKDFILKEAAKSKFRFLENNTKPIVVKLLKWYKILYPYIKFLKIKILKRNGI